MDVHINISDAVLMLNTCICLSHACNYYYKVFFTVSALLPSECGARAAGVGGLLGRAAHCSWPASLHHQLHVRTQQERRPRSDLVIIAHHSYTVLSYILSLL